MQADDRDEAPTPRKRGRGRLLVLVVLPLLLVTCLGGATAAYLLGVLPPGVIPGADAALGETAEPEVDANEIVFVDLPELLVNLNVAGSRFRFLKFAAALEVVGEAEAETVERFVPRISDNIHLYLRSLQLEELSGAEGVYRIKRDLLTRINQVVRPAEVREVLVKEMLIQ